MITKEHIQQVSNALEGLPSDKKLIIGVEGYSGTGKTTLLREVAKQLPSILPVHRDDFMIPRKEWEAIFSHTKDRSKALEYQAVDQRLIHEFASLYRVSNDEQTFLLRADESAGNKSGEQNIPCQFDFSKRIMVIEGMWLYHPSQFDDIFDYRIYLDADQETADKQRREREMARWGDQYFPDTHPESYFRLIKIAYNDYLEKHTPLERANLVIHL